MARMNQSAEMSPTGASPRRPAAFVPPTPGQVRSLLGRARPRGPSRRWAWLPLGAVALVMLVATAEGGGPLSTLLLLLCLAATVVGLNLRLRAVRRTERSAEEAQELALLRRWRSSLRLAWELLPRLTTLPPLHLRTVAAIAHDLDELGAYDAALVAYDYLIEHLPGDHPKAVQLRIQRVMLHLLTDRLTDADDELRRLRAVVEASPMPIGAAAYRLAQLMQRVATNHFAEAIELAGDLVPTLRPLSVEAAYGYGLMALAHRRLAQQGVSPDVRQGSAQVWWRRATLLLPAAALTQRFPALGELESPPTNAASEDSRVDQNV